MGNKGEVYNSVVIDRRNGINRVLSEREVKMLSGKHKEYSCVMSIIQSIIIAAFISAVLFSCLAIMYFVNTGV